MRFESLAINGIGPFRRHVSIDLSAIPGLLIAVTGGNGQGKSTFLECLGGALYRTTPTRGSLAELAVDRTGFVEARVVNGKSWTIRHTVDAVSGKGESTVKDADGALAFASAKVRDFDAWAAEHLPSPEVLYSSSFAPQGSGGFLDMKAGERKGVLLRVLGIEALERQSERARERARTAKQSLDVLAARLADERQRGGDVEVAETQLTEAETAASTADAALQDSRSRLEQARKAAHAVELRLEEFRTARAQNDEFARQRNEAASKADELRARIAKNQEVLEEADAIRVAVVRSTELDSALAQLRVDEAALVKDGIDAARRWQECEGQRRAAEGRAALCRSRLADRSAVEQAVAQLPAEIILAREDETREKELTAELEAERGAGLGLAEKRILELRPFVRRVADHEIPNADIQDRACDVIFEDDRLCAEAHAAPAEVARIEVELKRHRAQAADRRARLRQLESMAARAAEIETAQVDLAAATAEEATAKSERDAAELVKEEAGAGLVDVRARITIVTAEREQLAPLVGKAGPLANAETRLAELRPQVADLEAKALEINERMKPLSWAYVDRPPDTVDLRPFTAAVEKAEQEARTAHGMIKVAEARLESARLAQRKLADLEGQRGGVESDLADWTLLADSLGRDGLQALEIDAAGPELTELINDLLRTCVGSRWTVTVETTRLSSDGKKQIEGCEVRVLDTERGREGTAESLSGGERVLVGEAVSLALSMLACRRSGVQGPTLVRDESGAALDPANARNYVAMLRRAAELVGASHVLFVSHSPEVQDLADARIEIRDGEVTVAA